MRLVSTMYRVETAKAIIVAAMVLIGCTRTQWYYKVETKKSNEVDDKYIMSRSTYKGIIIKLFV